MVIMYGHFTQLKWSSRTEGHGDSAYGRKREWERNREEKRERKKSGSCPNFGRVHRLPQASSLSSLSYGYSLYSL